MNDYLLSLILGVIEGLTEFLPVSSTAHLRIGQDVFNIPLEDPFWKMYAIVIQLGAVLCLPIYFKSRIVDFLKTFPGGTDGTRTWLTHPLSLTMLAFAVTALPCYLLDKFIAENLENMLAIGITLIVGGVVMWVVDVRCKNPTTADMNQIRPWQAMVIGAAQILAATFPGTSRSMATIAAGQLAGLSRPAALEFSFFLSIPVMFAATLFKLGQGVLGKGSSADVVMDGEKWIILGIGFFVSFVVALAVVHWFMGYVRRRGFAPFAIYRIILGSAVIVWVVN